MLASIKYKRIRLVIALLSESFASLFTLNYFLEQTKICILGDSTMFVFSF